MRRIFFQTVIGVTTVIAMACAGGQSGSPSSKEAAAPDLRTMILSSKPAASGAQRDPAVVIMDIHVGEGIASVMSSSEGDASIYLSSGGGMIGGGGHQKIHDAAIAFVTETLSHRSVMQPTAAFPYPAAGNVRFYLRTSEGVFFIETEASRLTSGTDSLADAYRAGQEVITQFRELQESKK